jgi:hypothetical protein
VFVLVTTRSRLSSRGDALAAPLPPPESQAAELVPGFEDRSKDIRGLRPGTFFADQLGPGGGARSR